MVGRCADPAYPERPFPVSTTIAPSRAPFLPTLGAVGASFVVTGFLGRLPMATLQLAMLVYASDRLGSFGLGGLLVAALGLGGAAGGLVVGPACDRWGQRRTGLTAIAVQASALAGLLLVAMPPAPPLVPMVALAALTGAANPQVGSMARSRWASWARRRQQRHQLVSTAMAYEAAADETSFVVGPLAVSLLMLQVEPSAAMALIGAALVIAQGAFVLHPSARSRVASTTDPGAESEGASTASLGSGVPGLAVRAGGVGRRVLPMAVGAAGVGVVFGAVQTGLAAHFDSLGTPAVSGTVYACLGIGSAVAGLLTTRIPATVPLSTRMAVSGLALAAASLLLLGSSSPLLLAAACTAVGLAVAPVLVSAYALVERLSPESALTTAMTLLAVATVVGVSAGAALGGWLAEAYAPGAAFAVASAAGTVAAASGWASRRPERR